MDEKANRPSVAEWICLLVLFTGLAAMQILIGGTRMVFSLPAYGVVGVAALLGVFSWRRVRSNPNQLCLAATALFLLYVLSRALLSPVPYIARSDIHSVLGGLAVYFLVACVLTGTRQRMWMIVLLIALALGHVLVGAVQFRYGHNYMPISWLQRYDYEWRASGFYGCPNHLAGLLEVVGICGLSIVCWSRWPVWGKLLVGYAVGICYVGLVLTGSRGGYLSAATSLFVFAILSFLILRRAGGRRAWMLAAAGAFLVIVLGLGTAYSVGRSDRLKDRAQNTFDTSNMRLQLWKSALQQWKLAPIVGTGSATYLYYGRLLRDERMQRDPVYVHNDYLQLLAEYGLVGAAGFLLFLAAHLRHGLRNFARLGPKRVAASQLLPSNALALNLGALAAISGFVVHSIFDFNLHIPANVLLMAFVFALVANDGIIRARTPGALAGGQKLWRLLAPALGVVLLVQCARLWPSEYFSERARAAVRDYQPGGALLYSIRGLRYDALNPDLYHLLGGARSQFADRMDEPEAAASFRRAAIQAFKRAHELAPREQSYLLELASALDAAGEYEEAEKVFSQLRRLDPKSESLSRYYDGHLKAREKATTAPQPTAPPEGP